MNKYFRKKMGVIDEEKKKDVNCRPVTLRPCRKALKKKKEILKKRKKQKLSKR